MRIKKKTRLACLVVVFGIIILAVLSGCAKPDDSHTPAVKSADKITVTDCIGREVEVPVEVNSIGCLYAFSGHVVTMLGKGDKIVAIVEGLKRDVLLNEINPKIKTSLVPMTSGVINIEELIRTKPDLVFIAADTAGNKGETEKLRQFNIPYLVIDFNNINQQQYAIEMIGKAIGASDRAKKYNEFYQASIDRVKTKVKDIPIQDRVRVYHSVNEAARTDAKSTLPADLLQTAGAIDVSVNENLKLIEGTKYIASLEQILMWNPEVILANEPGISDYILGNNQWSTIKAVKTKKVFQMPIGISRWGHPGSLETPLAILWTAKTLYPDLFTNLDLVLESKDFYKKFFNYLPTDQVINQILISKGMRDSKS